MSSNFRKYFFVNTSSNIIFQILRLAISFFSVPVYLRVYGEEQYGLFLLSFGMISTLSFLDFGSGKSLLRYTAEYAVDKNKEKYGRALSASYSINIFSALLIAVAVIGMGLFSQTLFHIQNADFGTALQVFIISAAGGILLFLDFIPLNILQGYGVFHQRNKWQLITTFLSLILLIFIYFKKPALPLFCFLNVILLAVTLFIDYFLVWESKIVKQVKINLRLPKETRSSEIFNYTKEIFFISIIGFLSTQADRIIISTLINVSAVTIYTIITKPYYIFKSLYSNYYTVLQPEFSKAKSGNDTHRMKNLIKTGTRSGSIILLVIITLQSVFFIPFLHVWIRTNAYDNYFIWGILALFNLYISSIYGVLYRMLFITGETKLLLNIDAYTATVNAIISILLAYYVGFYGVIIGTTVQLALFTVLIFYFSKKKFNISLFDVVDFNYLLFAGIISSFAATSFLFLDFIVLNWIYLIIPVCTLLCAGGYIYFKRNNFLVRFA